MFSDRPAPPSSDEINSGGPAFVEGVRIGVKKDRQRRVEQLIVAGWVLIGIKSVVVWWACAHYAVPFHPMWIVGPTVAFAALCTGVYLFARR